MMHYAADLVKAVLTEAWIDARCCIKHKIAKRARGEYLAKVNGHAHLYGHIFLFIEYALFLHAHSGAHQNGGKIRRNGDAAFFCLIFDRIGIENEACVGAEAVHFPFALYAEGIAVRTRGGSRTCVLKEAVLKLGFIRLFEAVKHAVARRHLNAVFLIQVLAHKRFKEHKSAIAVRQRVEKFHRYSVFVSYYSECALAYIVKRHTRERIRLLLKYLGRTRHLLKIIPEKSAPNAHSDRRKAPYRNVKRYLQHRNVHRLIQRCRKAEKIAPVAAH